MQIPLSVRIRALFARDKDSFWWNHFTDEERELRQMDVQQLAAKLHEAQVRGDNERRIIVEHMLNVRLARIQASASWGSGVLGFAGALLGAGLSVALTTALVPSAEPKVSVKCGCGAQLSQPAPTASASKASEPHQSGTAPAAGPVPSK